MIHGYGGERMRGKGSVKLQGKGKGIRGRGEGGGLGVVTVEGKLKGWEWMGKKVHIGKG